LVFLFSHQRFPLFQSRFCKARITVQITRIEDTPHAIILGAMLIDFKARTGRLRQVLLDIDRKALQRGVVQL